MKNLTVIRINGKPTIVPVGREAFVRLAIKRKANRPRPIDVGRELGMTPTEALRAAKWMQKAGLWTWASRESEKRPADVTICHHCKLPCVINGKPRRYRMNGQWICRPCWARGRVEKTPLRTHKYLDSLDPSESQCFGCGTRFTRFSVRKRIGDDWYCNACYSANWRDERNAERINKEAEKIRSKRPEISRRATHLERK